MLAALIANECIDSRMSGVELGVVCRLEIQKASLDKWGLVATSD